MNVPVLALNAFGICIYLMLVSQAWAIPREQALGWNAPTGEPFIWAGFALPIYAVFLLLNLIWATLILGYRQWRGGRLWLSSALIWIVAVGIDFAHH